MTLSYPDRIFWIRVGFGIGTGFLSELLFYGDYLNGILLAIIVYFASFYLVRTLWGSKLKPADQRKLYTAGLGSFVLQFLFFWILLFTLGVQYLHL